MHAEAIAVGSEILAGYTRDANFEKIAATLAREGIALSQHTIVPDEREALGRALSGALDRSPLVIMTGGLGVTPDDVTRRVMASVLGRKLIYREGLLKRLRGKYGERGLPMSPAAEAMALVPSGAQPLDNSVGLAPGLMLRTERSLLFALPGVPAEMERMLLEEVVPVLRREGLAGRCLSRTLRTVGLSETALVERVHHLLGEGVSCAFLPSAGRVDLRLLVRDRDREARELDATVGRISRELGPTVYGFDQGSLEASVVSLLGRRGITVAVAESLSGGLIGGALARVPGSSKVFQGSIVAYCNQAKQELLQVSSATLQSWGAVSAQTAEEMAAGVRRALGADVGVSTTGIAGPSGGSPEKPVGLVYFGLSAARMCRSLRYNMGGGRWMTQDRCVTVALNMLRLLVMERLDLLWDGESRGAGGA
ncbi:MAG: CinA family nicotinamide mononucleotide deamidase-related protein [Candidatus Eisenbacteria sp.]|nr:CinA family nicotinamide mononucleotide deamidase-related protein [Candidatus Eisenbacteria bacterium]